MKKPAAKRNPAKRKAVSCTQGDRPRSAQPRRAVRCMELKAESAARLPAYLRHRPPLPGDGRMNIRADSSVRALLKPSPKDAAEQRLSVRKAAGRVIRSYKKAQPIHDNDAIVCAVSVAQLIDIMERAVRGKK